MRFRPRGKRWTTHALMPLSRRDLRRPVGRRGLSGLRVARGLLSRVQAIFASKTLIRMNEELRRLQAATAEANRWLLLGEQMAGVGHWRLGLPDNTLTWSDHIYRIHGLEKAETVLGLEMALAAYHPEDQELVRQNVASAIEARTGFESQNRLLRPNGEIRHVWSRGIVQTDAEGVPVSLFGVFIDVTEQKRMEAEQAAEQARQAQARRMEALGQLAGGVAHDINNVLQTISAASGMIETRADQAGEVARLGQLIGRTTERAAAIVSRLLVFARQSALRAEAVDVSALLDGLTQLLDHTLGGSIGVRLEVQEGLPPITADSAQLETVLVNIATNARDAMPGGGMITIRAETACIGPAGTGPPELSPGRYVSLSVRDEGTGMDGATLARAVEPFFTTKPRGRGTGLGLAMAAGFAEQSGGTLCLDSAPGAGTLVTLWLPEAAPDATAREAACAPEVSAADGRGALILLVDDESDLRELLANELVGHGYRVVQAVDGAAAREKLLLGLPVDLLVTDLSMPGLDGVSLIQAAQSLRPELPAILLTGHALDIARLAPERSRGCRYTLLSKPIRFSTLAAEVAVALERPRLRARAAQELAPKRDAAPAKDVAYPRVNAAM